MLELLALGKDLFTFACKFPNWVCSKYLSPHRCPQPVLCQRMSLGLQEVFQKPQAVYQFPSYSCESLWHSHSITFCLTSVIWKIKPDSFCNTWTIIFETNIYFHFVCIFPPKSNLLFSQRLSFLCVIVVLIVSWWGLLTQKKPTVKRELSLEKEGVPHRVALKQFLLSKPWKLSSKYCHLQSPPQPTEAESLILLPTQQHLL